MHHSPEIQAALSEIRRDQIMVRRERVEPIPNVFVQAVTGYNYEFGVQTAGVQIGVPLPVFNRNQGTVRRCCDEFYFGSYHNIVSLCGSRGSGPDSSKRYCPISFPRFSGGQSRYTGK